MSLNTLVLVALSVFTAGASPVYQRDLTFNQVPANTNLVWCPCYKIFTCARLSVPLDYQGEHLLRAYIPLVKIAANTTSSNGPYKGMVLFNPGGPGESGVATILQSGSQIQAIIGTNYDLIGFDPRGVGSSIPSGNCLTNYTLSNAYAPVSLSKKSSVVAPNEADTFITDSLTTGLEAAAVCGSLIGLPNQAGPYMTSAVNAQDMLSIVDAFQTANGLSGQGLLNYWGASYGSYIGQTFASMFPDRVGRMVVDGIIDPINWSSGLDTKLVIHTDECANTFFQDCFLAGKSGCSFYTGSSLSDIQARMQNIFAQLNAESALLHLQSNASAIEYALLNLKNLFVSSSLYPLTSFPVLSNQLVAYEALLKTRNVTNAAIDAIVGPNTSGIAPEWGLEILCSDQQTPVVTPAVIQAFHNQSSYGGEYVLNKMLICTEWPVKAKWRYSGPWGGSTKNSMLFVSNTIDPLTPIENGQLWSQQFKGAQFLTIQGAGHTSFSQLNGCAFGHINYYFQTGSMGQDNATCAQTRRPFDGLGGAIV